MSVPAVEMKEPGSTRGSATPSSSTPCEAKTPAAASARRWAVLLGGLMVAMLVGLRHPGLHGRKGGFARHRRLGGVEGELHRSRRSSPKRPRKTRSRRTPGTASAGRGSGKEIPAGGRSLPEVSNSPPSIRPLAERRRAVPAGPAKIRRSREGPSGSGPHGGSGVARPGNGLPAQGEFKKAETWWQKIANQQPRNDLAARLWPPPRRDRSATSYGP